MPKCFILGSKRSTQHLRPDQYPVGHQEIHFGYACEVDDHGQLVADVPEDLLQSELDAGRVSLI